MGILRLSRPVDGGGSLRRLRVEVDGREVAALRPRGNAEVPLAAGPHTAVARLDWNSSAPLEFTVDADEEVRIEVAVPVSSWDTVLRPRSALRLRRL
jgi:hypothetical protein